MPWCIVTSLAVLPVVMSSLCPETSRCASGRQKPLVPPERVEGRKRDKQGTETLMKREGPFAADFLYIPTTNARNRLTGYYPRRQRQDAATDAMIDINSNALAGSGTAEFNPTAEVLAALPKLVTQVLY